MVSKRDTSRRKPATKRRVKDVPLRPLGADKAKNVRGGLAGAKTGGGGTGGGKTF